MTHCVKSHRDKKATSASAANIKSFIFLPPTTTLHSSIPKIHPLCQEWVGVNGRECCLSATLCFAPRSDVVRVVELLMLIADGGGCLALQSYCRRLHMESYVSCEVTFVKVQLESRLVTCPYDFCGWRRRAMMDQKKHGWSRRHQ